MTLTAVWMFLRSPIGKRLLLGAAAAMAVYFVCLHFIEVGRLKGEAAATQRSVETMNQSKASDASATKDRLDAHDRRIEELAASAASSGAQANQLGALVIELAKQRGVAVAKADQVPDAGLHAYNVDQLHIRGPDDRTACYLPAEERAIGKCLAAQPYVDEEIAKASDRADKLEAEVRDVKGQVAEHEAKFVDLAGYTTRVEGYYVSLYNLTAKPKRGLKCVYLWSCARPKLPTPDPKQFLQTSAQPVRR